VPTQVQALKSHKVIDIALGSGDSHSLCVTTAGHVFAWGDGDFGKLGNGSSNGSQIPQQIEGLEKIVNVYSGSQFSVALSSEGAVFTWGKGHGGRLGHGGSDHISVPKVVQALEGKQICQISVGSAHCLALTNTGELYGWGRNDYQQICPVSINRDPIIATPILTTPPSLRIAGVSCGPAQSIAWCNSSSLGISTKIPFAVDLSEHSFRLLDQLLCMVCGNSGSTVSQTGTDTRHPPNQEAECIAVACLNILRLQLHAIIANNLSARQVGLCEGSRLLASLKTRVLSLAGGPTVLKTMQEAAQWTLQVGWSVLLPTASERAQTLTALLPTGHEGSNTSPTNNCTSGYRFMTDLLVGSLMAEGGLQTALNQAINAEPQDVNSEHHLPLLHLLKQLLR
jgi:E3 ubiquitin-protein ligase HERC2